MKPILTIMVILSISSCNLFLQYTWEFPEPVDNLDAALNHIGTYQYKSDDNGDQWALPHETYNRGYGDCEDLSSLLANIMIFKLGMDAELITAKFRFADLYHMAVIYDGRYFEATSGREWPAFELYYEPLNTYSYDEYCHIAQTAKK